MPGAEGIDVERGNDAIDQLTWYEYDVAVIDWRMPGAERGRLAARWGRTATPAPGIETALVGVRRGRSRCV